MKSSIIYLSISALALCASVVIIVCKKIPQDELHLLLTKGVAPASLINKSNSAHLRRIQNGTAPAVESVPAIRTDEELEKLLAQLPILKEIPWQPSEVATLYSNHSARPCQLLGPGISLDPLPVEGTVAAGQSTSQFMTAFQIGLSMNAKARAKLSPVTRSTIENYLDQHVLAIQPEICRRADGQKLLTGQVRAAFFSKNSPSVSLTPEPMIQESITNLRVLGVLPGNSPAGTLAMDDNDRQLPRTLVMAFSYLRDKDTDSPLTLEPQPEFELIFLHLLPQNANTTGAAPEIAVFATSDGCTGFQELNLAAESRQRTPAVQANIRFDKSKFLGQYPADPIVTGLSNQVRSYLSVEEILARLAGLNGQQAISLQQVLDELHEKPVVAGTTTLRK